MTELNQRYLGGETGHRTLWGSGQHKTRNVGFALVFVGGIFAALIFREVGLLAALAAAVLVFVGTMETHAGSVWERWRARRRWRLKQRHGLAEFRPVQTRPVDLPGAEGTRRSRGRTRREWTSYRDWADGAEGMQWLFSRPRAPGIAWHTPTGEDAWLSVVFPLAGQIRGLQSNDIVNSKSQAFGSLLSQLGSASSLPNRIQLITRVQPVDTAMHESWVASEVDPDADRELLDSYREVVERLGRGSLMQRHFAVVRWPLTPAFLAEAERRAPAQRGWVMLMGEEIDAAHREMTSAGLGPGRALSAAQVGAVLRHQQLPSWPIDQARDIDPNNLWLPSKEEWPYVAVTGRVPSGEVETWLHRTAVVPIQHVNTSARGPLWMMPMLAQMRGRVVRTISVQLEGVPQSYARAQAREDFTSDLADEEAQRIKGRLVDDELVVGKHASKARVQDLKPGKPHQGLGWAIHVTVSATSRDELRGACRHMEEAAGKAGLDRLYWLDSYHAAAQACTWPLARGMKPSRTSAGAWMTGALAGTGHKEAL